MYLSEGTIKLTQNHTFIRQRILGRQGNNCGLQSVANSLDVGNRSLDHYILSISWQTVTHAAKCPSDVHQTVTWAVKLARPVATSI